MSNNAQPEIRFPGFTEGWEQHKLIEVARYRNGKAHEQAIDESGKYIVVNSKFVSTNGRVKKYTNIIIDPLKKNELAFVLSDVPNGKAIARTFLVDKEHRYSLNQRIAGITPHKDTDSYFLNVLMNRNPYFLKFDNGVGQTNLTKADVENFIGHYPSYEEQQKIGTFFKQLDDTIALHQRKLDLLKETKKGFLQKMFPKNGAKVPEVRFPGFTGDWEQRKLNDFISGDISDGDWIEKEHIKDEGKYRIIQTGNIGNGVYIDKEKSAKYMDQNSFDILKANEIFPGDLLVSRLAEPAGRTVILPNIEDRMVTAVDVTILRQNENFDAYFLLSQMNTSKILNKVSKNVSGTSHKRISRKNLEKVTIDSTSIEEQNKIGAFFKQLDDTIALHQRKLDLLKETKKGFLQKMFV
ncbi:restriction endonuclease subunit S [Enterococcus faecium]|nr:restriction endonuclease subunit S [Enterococcus faecium]